MTKPTDKPTDNAAILAGMDPLKAAEATGPADPAMGGTVIEREIVRVPPKAVDNPELLNALDFMLSIMRDPSQHIDRRLHAAHIAAPYCHPQLVQLDHLNQASQAEIDGIKEAATSASKRQH